ncbi:hypothetical protein D3C71_1452220 [compost metagenome]
MSTAGTGLGMTVCEKSGEVQNSTSAADTWMRTSGRKRFFTSSTKRPPTWSMCMWVMITSVTDSRAMPADSRRCGNIPARGKPGNCPPRPASIKMVCLPLRATITFKGQSKASGGMNMWSSQFASSAGSTLVAMVEVGSGSTPSLTTIASISPTCTA